MWRATAPLLRSSRWSRSYDLAEARVEGEQDVRVIASDAPRSGKLVRQKRFVTVQRGVSRGSHLQHTDRRAPNIPPQHVAAQKEPAPARRLRRCPTETGMSSAERVHIGSPDEDASPFLGRKPPAAPRNPATRHSPVDPVTLGQTGAASAVDPGTTSEPTAC